MLEIASPEPEYKDAMAALACADFRKARSTLKKLAIADHLPSLVIYASLLEFGVGGKPSEHKALAFYRRGALLGESVCLSRLVRWHIQQGQIPQAKYWLKKAQFDPRALLTLIKIDFESQSAASTEFAYGQLRELRWNWLLTKTERDEVERLIATDRCRTTTLKAILGRGYRRATLRRLRVEAEKRDKG